MDLIANTNLESGRELDLLPAHVPGRVVHVDADILAYILSAKVDKVKQQATRRNMIKDGAAEYVKSIKFEAGADKVIMHTTPSASTKGGRFDQALLKVYQANRKDKVKPKELTWAREYLGKSNNLWEGIPHMDQEADDGLAQALYNARKAGTPELCVITSSDKDLRMCPGLHMNWDDHTEIKEITEVGELWIEEKVSKSGAKSKKVKGNGFKWFCYQMLAGDTADNISGIPALTQEMCLEYLGKAPKNGKPKKCGGIAAIEILNEFDTVEDLFKCILHIYSSYGNELGFEKFTGEKITIREAFLSEAYLLWMRETKSPKDFNRWVHENDLVVLFKEFT